MAENINTGLGEAIAGGTNLSGQWDNPITKGFQLDAQMDFKRLEQEKAKQLALEKKQEVMQKLTTFDEGKWENPEIARKFKEYADSKLPKMTDKFIRGDRMGAMKVRSEIENEMKSLKFFDRSVSSLRKLPENAATKGSLTKDFNEGGIFKIMEEDAKFNFLPTRIQAYDEQTGFFQPVTTQNPNINRQVAQKAKARLSEIPKTFLLDRKGNREYYGIDPESPAYLKAKADAVVEILDDDKTYEGILYTKDFRDYYKGYLKKQGAGDREDTKQDLILAVQEYVEEKFDENKVVPVEKITKGSGGSTSKSMYQFSINADGKTAVIYNKGMRPANPTFEGINIYTKVDGTQERIKETAEINNPIIDYLGKDKFLITGTREEQDGVYRQIEQPMEVDKGELMFKLGLDEAKLRANFPKYAKEKGGAGKPKTGQPAKPKQGSKMTFPQWKAQNPNGTAAQFKQYLKG